MSAGSKDKKRARHIQRETGWSYVECLRLARERISDDGLAALKQMRAAMTGPRYEHTRVAGNLLRTAPPKDKP